jgi:hypothetical protein
MLVHCKLIGGPAADLGSCGTVRNFPGHMEITLNQDCNARRECRGEEKRRPGVQLKQSGFCYSTADPIEEVDVCWTQSPLDRDKQTFSPVNAGPAFLLVCLASLGLDFLP